MKLRNKRQGLHHGVDLFLLLRSVGIFLETQMYIWYKTRGLVAAVASSCLWKQRCSPSKSELARSLYLVRVTFYLPLLYQGFDERRLWGPETCGKVSKWPFWWRICFSTLIPHCLKTLSPEFRSLSLSGSGKQREENQNQRTVLRACSSLRAHWTMGQEECGSLLSGQEQS